MFIKNYQLQVAPWVDVRLFSYVVEFSTEFFPDRFSMSLASDKLQVIRQQVQFHLDNEAKKQLSPAQEEELRELVKARLIKENAVIVAHY